MIIISIKKKRILDNKIIKKNNKCLQSINHNYINNIKNYINKYFSNRTENNNLIKKSEKNNNPQYLKKDYENFKIININKKIN